MTTYLIALYLVLSCALGALSIVGVMYPKIRKKSVDSQEIADVALTETKPYLSRSDIIYCIFAFVSTIAVAIWLLVHFRYVDLIFMIKRVAIISVLLVAAYYDKASYRIPNKLIMFGLLGRVVLLIFELLFSSESIYSVFISEFAGAGALLLFSVIGLLITRNGIGMGDIKLFILMGLFQGLVGVVSSIFISLTVTFVYSLFLLITKKKSKKDYVAFAPCILVGTFISVVLLGN